MPHTATGWGWESEVATTSFAHVDFCSEWWKQCFSWSPNRGRILTPCSRILEHILHCKRRSNRTIWTVWTVFTDVKNGLLGVNWNPRCKRFSSSHLRFIQRDKSLYVMRVVRLMSRESSDESSYYSSAENEPHWLSFPTCQDVFLTNLLRAHALNRIRRNSLHVQLKTHTYIQTQTPNSTHTSTHRHRKAHTHTHTKTQKDRLMHTHSPANTRLDIHTQP